MQIGVSCQHVLVFGQSWMEGKVVVCGDFVKEFMEGGERHVKREVYELCVDGYRVRRKTMES